MNPENSSRPTQTKRRMFHSARKVVAVVLAACIPGTGHLFLGLFIRGLTFMILLLLDISAMLYVSSDGLQINIPLLVLLGLFIPVLYFYNVYDVLQSADYMMRNRRKPDRNRLSEADDQQRSVFYTWERGISFALLLVIGGGFMVLFLMKPRWLSYFFADYGFLAMAIILIIGGLIIFLREVGLSWKHRKLREGR